MPRVRDDGWERTRDEILARPAMGGLIAHLMSTEQGQRAYHRARQRYANEVRHYQARLKRDSRLSALHAAYRQRKTRREP
jgi:hypothetical protein